MISKSTFLTGCQCPKALWMGMNKRDLRDEISPEQQAIFSQGHLIGALAQKKFPDGIDLREENWRDYETQAEKTRLAMAGKGRVIFEAAFLADGLYAAVDVLIRNRTGWTLVEVKGTADVKDVHLLDVAFQIHVLTKAGVDVTGARLMHLDRDYLRRGELDPEKIFASQNIFADVKRLLPDVEARARTLKKVAKAPDEPSVSIGPHCTDPYPCAYQGHCWADVPEDSVFALTGMGGKAWTWWQKGIRRVDEIPAGHLTDRAGQIVSSIQKKQLIFDERSVSNFLEGLQYPLGFLDFETVNPALPLYNETSPFQQIPFQYSLHIMDKPGADPIHRHFLAEPGADPRSELAKQLAQDGKDIPCILAWNMGFEKRVLEELSRTFPRQTKDLSPMARRLVDLMAPFRNLSVHHPDQYGSASLKAVLPALFPGESYDDLEIGEGGAASTAFLAACAGEDKDWPKTREHLLAYCERDTLSMVKIYQWLAGKVSDSN